MDYQYMCKTESSSQAMQNSKDLIFSKNSIQLFKKTSNVKAWLRQPQFVLSHFIKTNNKNG